MTRRSVFYLFRLSSPEPVAVARFTDRADAIRAAWAAEALGWRAEVRRRYEGGPLPEGSWEREYRSAASRAPTP